VQEKGNFLNAGRKEDEKKRGAKGSYEYEAKLSPTYKVS